MIKLVFSGSIAGVFGAAMLLSSATPASAVTLPSAALAVPAEAAMVEKVGSHGGITDLRPRSHRAQRSRRHAKPRYRHRGRWHARPSYRHYRHHYGPSFGFSIVVPGFAGGLGGGSSAHVEWCMQRYRTYDPATDTYIPRVGERAYCISPYS